MDSWTPSIQPSIQPERSLCFQILIQFILIQFILFYFSAFSCIFPPGVKISLSVLCMSLISVEPVMCKIMFFREKWLLSKRERLANAYRFIYLRWGPYNREKLPKVRSRYCPHEILSGPSKFKVEI